MPMIPVPKAVLDGLKKQADQNNGVVSVNIAGLFKDGQLEAIKLNNETIPGYEEDAKEMDSGTPSDEDMEDKSGDNDNEPETSDKQVPAIIMAFRKHTSGMMDGPNKKSNSPKGY